MLVCSPDAANKFALLAEAIEKTDGIPLRFKNFINSARRDLDLIDNVDAGASNRFDIILKKLETAVSEETQNFRFRTDDEKINLIREYDKLTNNKGTWLKKKSFIILKFPHGESATREKLITNTKKSFTSV